ncbi:MAG: type II toxin-antitoxin system HicB family antitoxin [Magnetococcales bacterium]|nr:type II toxin-antitoxin system HicB family antitoxin [Magnetococcales bacterium]MBF0116071.1 type II toxin-antitoxin system HicB family antitoxin [Magnetococcales bacterium]
MDIRYPAIMESQEPAGFFIRFLDVEEAFTEGSTREEALQNAAEVLTALLGWRMDQGLEIPQPSQDVKEAFYVAPDAKTQAALLLRFAMERPVGTSRGHQSRKTLSSTRDHAVQQHRPSLRQLEKAAARLGKRLVLSFD